MAGTSRHKVFVSFHTEDRVYKEKFVKMLGNHIVDKSVGDGDVDKDLDPDEIRRQIRDDFIAGATVTVVLVGHCTWRRMHVDWEIGASLMDTERNDRCGLLCILLPSHPDFGKDDYNLRLIPPRLAYNLDGENPFAIIGDWTRNKAKLTEWIDQSFRRRNKYPHPNNKYPPFKEDVATKCAKGWQG